MVVAVVARRIQVSSWLVSVQFGYCCAGGIAFRERREHCAGHAA